MKKLFVAITMVLVVLAGCAYEPASTSSLARTEETQVQATVTYVLKTAQYVPSAHQMLYTIRYDLTVSDTTQTFVATSYTVLPKVWSIAEGDVVQCTLVTTYNNQGEVIAKKIK